MNETHIPAVLLLEDGTLFEGSAIGSIGTTVGEIAFNTAMTGYQEVFSDPSYFGQIIVMTNAHIGNYGVHSHETESDQLMIAGLVTHHFSSHFSRPKTNRSLSEELKTHNKIGISDIDTRALVRHIRHKGSMNALISSENKPLDELKKELSLVPSMNGLELSSKVSTSIAYEIKPKNVRFRVAVVDFGIKKNILRCMEERGVHVQVFPMDTPLTTMEEFSPDGYFLSNGPGDPHAMSESITLVAEIISLGKPVFGICLGHQLIGLSQGLRTKKMINGHRGINHPIKNLITQKAEITSQNHGFVIDDESLAQNPAIQLTHIHLNDNSVAGIALRDKPVFSVQYHPEAAAGPHDSRYLFDQFIDLLKKHSKK